MATAGAGWALLIDGVSFFVSAVLLLAMRSARARTDATDGPPASVLGDLLHGWHEFTARRWVWVMVALFSLSNFGFTAAIDVLGPVRSLASWGGARGWAVVLTAFSIGTVVGVIGAERPLDGAGLDAQGEIAVGVGETHPHEAVGRVGRQKNAGQSDCKEHFRTA